MRHLALVASALLLAPAVISAQPYSPHTPVAFTGPTQTYALHGCGDGPLSGAPGAPSVRIVCLDGTATVGVATSASGAQFFQTVLDLTGTRLNGFAGRFFDIDYSNIQLSETLRDSNGRISTVREGFGPPLDPTGHTTSAYALLYPVYSPGSPGSVGIVADGITFGPSGVAQLGYVPPDVPNRPMDYGRYLPFDLTITAVPEPATLALTLGGLAVISAGAWRRRRTQHA